MSAAKPEEYIERLRAIREEMGEVHPLTAAERKALRNQIIASDEVLHKSINIVDVHPSIQQSLARTSEEIRAMQIEADRWTSVEAELRLMFEGVRGANLIRRQRISLIAMQAYVIGAQLARDPANADLVPHVETIRHLRRMAKRRGTNKPAEAPQE